MQTCTSHTNGLTSYDQSAVTSHGPGAFHDMTTEADLAGLIWKPLLSLSLLFLGALLLDAYRALHTWLSASMPIAAINVNVNCQVHQT